MEITREQFAKIAQCFPKPRGTINLSALHVLNAVLYVAENGCKWRALPARFGNWHTIYTRLSRWSKKGILQRVFEELQVEQLIGIKVEAVSLDSTSIKVHPDGTGALKKNGPQAIGKSRGGWTTKIHLVAADERRAIGFSLSPGSAHDAPEGRQLLLDLGRPPQTTALLMDRAYEGDNTRQLAIDLGYVPVVPPKENRLKPWEYDKALYKRRNEVERLFRRLKAFRRIFSRFEKLDVMLMGFIYFVLIVEGLKLR